MSKFFVGQRVRVVSSDGPEGRQYVGLSARIVEIDCGENWVSGEDAYGLDVLPIQSVGDGYWITWAEHELEPILPEGHQPSEFESLHDLLHSLGVEVAA